MSVGEDEEVPNARAAEEEADARELDAEGGQDEVAPADGKAAEAEAAENEGEAEEQGEGSGFKGQYNARNVNDQIFDELVMGALMVDEVQSVWSAFLRSAESRELAGEAIYSALFDSAPSLQSLFKTPRAVMAMRFMNGLNLIIGNLQDPKSLKIVVETLGFQHLDLEVTVPRVVIFRDAITDLLQVELGARFTKNAKEGWCTFLNYVGGAYIYVRTKFADRLKILASSWATANNRRLDEFAQGDGAGEKQGEEANGEDKDAAAPAQSGDVRDAEAAAQEAQNEFAEEAAMTAARTKAKRNRKGRWAFGGVGKGSDSKGDAESNSAGGQQNDGENSFRNTTVPTTYNEMFMFNAAVMGFGGNTWMNEVLFSFHTIVTNVANSYRLQEECDVLSLRLAKQRGSINLPEYKAVMLASLRSLLPKDWNSAHEVAWSWLWENVERMIRALVGKPAQQERALEKLWASLDDSAQALVRRDVYAKFFALAPAGQDYFKQSTTRLHFIADRIVAMTLEIYKDPKKMVEDISALGLRHVGYGIPTDLIGPFVTACVQVVRGLTTDDLAEEAFRWSLGLVSRILTRVINEGSTIVMKAINVNSGKQLKKAVGCAPRGRRALWMLNIQVGTQAISPLLWGIETGSLDAAKAIIVDLLTIRADRDRYYYGMDIMFERHPDIIKRLCMDAPALLPTLLDGLVWRSRTTENGQRRVNYYIQHLVADADGEFSKTVEWITDNRDPKLVCHPILSLVTDMVWTRIAYRTFLYGKSWFLLTLIIFICSQAILNHLNSWSHGADDEGHAATHPADSHASQDVDGSGPRRLVGSSKDSRGITFEVRVAILACRCFIYFASLTQLMYVHIRCVFKAIRAKDYLKLGRFSVPVYLGNWQEIVSLTLAFALVLMLAMEPILHCLTHVSTDQNEVLTEHCQEGEDVLLSYSVASTTATLLYFMLLIDLTVFSTHISAFVLVCGRVLSEVGLFLFGLAFVVLAFASAISALEQEDPDFAGIPTSALNLLKMTFRMFNGTHYDLLEEFPALLVAVLVYVITTIIFLANLLIAQLNCAYSATYQDMLGYARLNRGKIVTEAMASASSFRWRKFIGALRLDERCEFGEGDLGLTGGIQQLEPASANITTVDMIRRFGGSTSPAAQWPEEYQAGDDEEDRFDSMEKLIERAMCRMSSKGAKTKATGGANSSQDLTSSDQGAGAAESGGSKGDSEQDSAGQ